MRNFRIRTSGEVLDERQLLTLFPNMSIPTPITTETANLLGVDVVQDTPMPVATLNQSVVEIAPIEVDGTWTRAWEIIDLSPDEIDRRLHMAQFDMWESIKIERDRRHAGGVKIGDKWYHSDSPSCIQWLGLKDRARDLLALGGTMQDPIKVLGQDVYWDTMDRTAQLVTIQLAFDVVEAKGDLDGTLHVISKTHKAAMEASTDPASYNFRSGWPQTFDEYIASLLPPPPVP